MRRANSDFPSKNIRRKGTHPRYPFANNVHFTSLVSSRILSCSMNAGCANHRVICHDPQNFLQNGGTVIVKVSACRSRFVMRWSSLERRNKPLPRRYPVCRAFGPWHCHTCKWVLCSTCTPCTFPPPHGLEREGAEIMQSCLTRLVHVPGLRYMTRWGRRLRRSLHPAISVGCTDHQTLHGFMLVCLTSRLQQTNGQYRLSHARRRTPWQRMKWDRTIQRRPRNIQLLSTSQSAYNHLGATDGRRNVRRH